jgi:hypothetical protein
MNPMLGRPREPTRRLQYGYLENHNNKGINLDHVDEREMNNEMKDAVRHNYKNY